MFILGIILPLFISIFTGSFGRFLGFYGIRVIIVIGMIITIMINIINLNIGIHLNNIYIQYSTFLALNTLVIPWSFQMDNIVVTMITMVTMISGLVQLYSCSYMYGDPHQVRFLIYLVLFTFFMIFFVSAGNLIQLFVGWEGVGLCSYLLINFWFGRLQANKSAIKAMLMNKVGDAGLLVSFAFIFFLLKDITFSTLFSSELVFSLSKSLEKIYMINLNNIFMIQEIAHKNSVYWSSSLFEKNNFYTYNNILNNSLNTEINLFLGEWAVDWLIIFIFVFIFLGVMSKSAQLGLHMWLPDAMEGPTPVSSLIHAATMVTAGIFAFIRLSPIFNQYKFLFNIVIGIGAITAVYSAITALTQSDSKKIIAFSTCSQLGYMIMAVGIHLYNLSFFHLINHAFFKALLFLMAGSIIHIILDDQDIRTMGSIQKFAPITEIYSAIGTIAIIGFPFMSGFYSKDIIIEATYLSSILLDKNNENLFINFSFYIAILTAGITTFYSFRLAYLIYFGNLRSQKVIVPKLKESLFPLILPLVGLSFGSIGSGYFFRDYFIGTGMNTFTPEIMIDSLKLVLYNCEYLPIWLKLVPLIILIIVGLVTIHTYVCNSVFLWSLKILLHPLFQTLILNLNFNWLQNKLSLITLQTGYSIFFYNLDKGILEKLGPLMFLKILKQLTTYFLQYQLKSLYDYSINVILIASAIMSIIYLNISFFIEPLKIYFYNYLYNEQTNAEVLPIDILINISLGIAVISSIFCFWVQHNKPIISLGFFLMIILPNIVILFILKVEYLALIFLIVYAGAIVILFLFILIMCESNSMEIKIEIVPEKNHNIFILLTVCIVFIVYLIFSSKFYIYLNWFEQLNQTELSNLYSNDFLFYAQITCDITFFGEYLLNHSTILLVIAGLILIIAMIGSILIITS